MLDKAHGDSEEIERLLKKLHIRDLGIGAKEFPSGNMFWARTKAIKDMFNNTFSYEDFPPEMGQLDGTIMHAIERCWCKIAVANGYRCEMI